MTFEEKSGWATLASVVLAYGWYLGAVRSAVADGMGANEVYQQPLVVMVVLLVVLVAGAHTLIALHQVGRGGKVTTSDVALYRVADRRARAVGGVVLAVGAVAALGLSMVEADHVWISNAILAALVGSQLSAQVIRIVVGRRSRESGTDVAGVKFGRPPAVGSAGAHGSANGWPA